MALAALVAVQVALAFVLIAAAGLAMRAVGDLRGRDVGINPPGLLERRRVPASRPVRHSQGFRGRRPRDGRVQPCGRGPLRSHSRGAAGRCRASSRRRAWALTRSPQNPFVQFWIGDAEHTPDNRVAAQYLAVTENYFNTMGIRVVPWPGFLCRRSARLAVGGPRERNAGEATVAQRRSDRAAVDADVLSE